jgi:hypothetical protein
VPRVEADVRSIRSIHAHPANGGVERRGYSGWSAPDLSRAFGRCTAARPTYLAYALVSVSTRWNNFLWPLIVTSSPSTRPLTGGLSLFAAPESGVDISVIPAATRDGEPAAADRTPDFPRRFL